MSCKLTSLAFSKQDGPKRLCLSSTARGDTTAGGHNKHRDELNEDERPCYWLLLQRLNHELSVLGD